MSKIKANRYENTATTDGGIDIDTSGRVGIGTAAPQRALVVSDAGAEGFEFYPGSSDTANTLNHYDRASSSFIDIINNADKHIFGRSDGEKMRIDSSGNVGIGTSSPSVPLTVSSASDHSDIAIFHAGGGTPNRGLKISTFSSTNANAGVELDAQNSTGAFKFSTGGTERLRIDSSGNVGIGTTPNSDSQLHVKSGANDNNPILRLEGATNNFLNFRQTGSVYDINVTASDPLSFTIGATERMRIDSSGRLLVGVSSGGANLVVGGIDTPSFNRGAVAIKAVTDDNSLPANIYLEEASGAEGYTLSIDSDGDLNFHNSGAATPTVTFSDDNKVGIGTSSPQAALDIFTSTGPYFRGGSDNTARQLVIESSTTTNAGDTHTFRASSNTGVISFANSINSERLRIDSSGRLLVGKSASGNNDNGAELLNGDNDYAVVAVATNTPPHMVNRKGSDGELIQFRQDNSVEGNISVSGSTVSYNGGHLARWSQLAAGAARTEILRGSVLSNLDEMCEWGQEDNEQLNRMQVSDVEGDKNVSGVFQSWDDDDDTYVNDFYCAMTGDFVIRIAQGTTVARGDLLMSAGDGTAKPQDDDIVRSKTIAKVTSTTVSTTYSDNSYCVPCVLMAC